MDIKGGAKEKQIQMIGGLLGLCVTLIALIYTFHAEKRTRKKDWWRS